MNRITSRAKGFEVTLNGMQPILCIRVWGFWDTGLAEQFEDMLREKLNVIEGQDWYALADFRGFYPRSERVQQMVRQQLILAEQRGMQKIGYLGRRLVIELQLNRPFLPADMSRHAFFDSEDIAVQWLLSG